MGHVTIFQSAGDFLHCLVNSIAGRDQTALPILLLLAATSLAACLLSFQALVQKELGGTQREPIYRTTPKPATRPAAPGPLDR